MNEAQEKLLQKARKSLEAAKQLNETGYPEFAVTRAYYTMFYVASAFLEGQSLAFSKHSAVIAAFGKYFAKTGLVPLEYHRYLINAEKARCSADYNLDVDFLAVEVEEYIQQAEDFLSVSIRLMGE